MTKTHLCNQILSLSVLSAYTLILGLIEKIEAILLFNSTSLLKMKKKKILQTTVKSLYILTYIPPKLSLPRDINRRMGFEPE